MARIAGWGSDQNDLTAQNEGEKDKKNLILPGMQSVLIWCERVY